EHRLGPEVVVARPALADQEVDLAQYLDADQDQQPGRVDRLQPHRVVEREDRVAGYGGPHQQEERGREEQQELDPVPERTARPGHLGGALVWGAQALYRQHLHGRRLQAHGALLTVNEVTTSLILTAFLR